MKVDTDYKLRDPSREEIVDAFGSLQEAYRVTGGDLPTLCFYLANPDRVPAAPTVGFAGTKYAKAMRDAVETEVVTSAWDAQPADKRRTMKAVMDATGEGRGVVRRILDKAGRLSA